MMTTTTFRSLSALFALVSLTAFGIGCSAEVGEELGTSEAAIGALQDLSEPSCPEGEHEETVCTDGASARFGKKSPKKSSIIAPPVCETVCVPDDEPPPPAVCPEGQHEETVCTDGASALLGKKSPKKSSVIAPPACETICVDDEPPTDGCPEGTELQQVCAPSAAGDRRTSSLIAPPECWDECVPVN
jgi:hypothetical protein